MRFARQSAIFRGPLDPAAVVSVLFLLVIFMIVGSLTYTPGVVVNFRATDVPDSQTITVTGDNTIIFNGKTNQVADLEALRDGDLKHATNALPFKLRIESGADPKTVEQVRSLFQIQLTTNNSANLVGTDNPTVVVAVNFRGQSFFENRPISESELKEELRARLQEAARRGKKLTMVLEADRSTENEIVVRLCRLARQAGISDILLP